MTEITNVNKIKLNILTQNQYDSMEKDPTEFYLVTDGKINFNELDNLPDFATVATSGDYNDLINKPVVDQIFNNESANAQSGTAIASAINSAISSVYKPVGSKNSVSQLPNLSVEGQNVLGNVYNMTMEFTTTADFVEGADKKYPGGTNIVVVNTGTSETPVYKFDVLAGFIDLTPYALSSSLSNVAISGDYNDLLNKPIVDQTYDAESANAQSGTAVASAINSAISSVYKPVGTIAYASLPTPSSSNLGNVYNINDSFTTDNRFVEGSGKTYPAGSNVVIVEGIGDITYYCFTNGIDTYYTLFSTVHVGDNVYIINNDEATLYGIITQASNNSIDGIDDMIIPNVEYNSSQNVVLQGQGYFFDVLAGFIDLSPYALSSSLATVATSGSYNDLTNTPVVDSVYNSASTNAQSGVAVASALSYKQDTLVSGVNIKTINSESLLGSGDIELNTSIDEDTITLNNDDELQTVGIINQNDDSNINTLKIWNGTEEEWEKGEVKDTYYEWMNMNININKTPVSGRYSNIIYSNERIITYNNKKYMVYSDNNGETWSYKSITADNGVKLLCSDDKNIVIATNAITDDALYSTDNGNSWNTVNITNSHIFSKMIYGDDKFIATVENSDKIYYSKNGLEWDDITLQYTGNWNNIDFVNNKFIIIDYDSDKLLYSNNAMIWEESTLPSSGGWKSIIYAFDKYFIFKDNSRNYAYSYDLIEWHEMTISNANLNNTWCDLLYYDNILYVFNKISSNLQVFYSRDGISWNLYSYSSFLNYPMTYYINVDDKIFTSSSESYTYNIYDFSLKIKYIQDENPTTESTVYDNIDVESELTITSVDTTNNTITLSDEKVYKNTGNLKTYNSIGDIYPNYIANIDNVGIKIGNTDIATSTLHHDNITIIGNENDKLQVEGIINQNTELNSLKSLKVWNGNNREWHDTGLLKDTYYAWENMNIIEGYSTGRISWNYGCYGNGRYVLMDYESISYSYDGINWFKSSSTVSNMNYSNLIYENNKFMSLGLSLYTSGISSENIVTSENGINWSHKGISTDKYWCLLAYGNGRYVILSSDHTSYNLVGDKGMYSDDGVNWTEYDLPLSSFWYGLAYGNGRFIAHSYNKIMYSDDGVNWTEIPYTIPETNGNIRPVIFGNGKFIIVNYASNELYESEDGVTWNTHLLPSDSGNGYWMNISYDNGKYFIIKRDSVSSTINCVIYYSYDLDNWNKMQIPNVNNAYFFIGGDKEIIMISSGVGNNFSQKIIFDTFYTKEQDVTLETRLYSEPDNISRERILSINNINKSILVSDNVRYFLNENALIKQNYTVSDLNKDYICNVDDVGVKIGSNMIATNSKQHDEYTITLNKDDKLQTTSIINPNTDTSIKIWNGTEEEWKIGKDKNWYQWRHENPLTWNEISLSATKNWSSICYGNGKFVAVASSYNNVIVSEDGITWNTYLLPAQRSWNKIKYLNNKFVAIASNINKGAVSDDGENWVEFTLSSSENWSDISYGDGIYMIIARNTDKCIMSEDLVNWEEITLPRTENWCSIDYGNERFVIFSGTSNRYTTLTSTDKGQSWTISKANSGDGATGVMLKYCKNKFIALSLSHINYNSSYIYYSYDGIGWMNGSFIRIPLQSLAYGDGKYVFINGKSTNSYAYTYNPLKITQGALSENLYLKDIAYGNGKFVSIANNSDKIYYATMDDDIEYSLEYTLSTNSELYDEPEVLSQKTITNVNLYNTELTLSDNKTYVYDHDELKTTHYTIGESYPDYLCNIDNVGVKIGDTLIADKTDTSSFQTTSNIVTSISNESTDDEYPSAKCMWDLIKSLEDRIEAVEEMLHRPPSS